MLFLKWVCCEFFYVIHFCALNLSTVVSEICQSSVNHPLNLLLPYYMLVLDAVFCNFNVFFCTNVKIMCNLCLCFALFNNFCEDQ